MIIVNPDHLGEDLHFTVHPADDNGRDRKVSWVFDNRKSPREKYKVRKRTRSPGIPVNSLPVPFERLMTCQSELIPTRGIRAMQWATGESRIARNRSLERLATRIVEAMRERHEAGRELNCLAALELLVAFQSPTAAPILESWLKVRPVTETHLYLITLPRSLPLTMPRAERLGSLTADVFETLHKQREAVPEWVCRLDVEAFRTVAAIAPKTGLPRLVKHIAAIGPLEISAVLEAVLQTVRQGSASPNPALTEAGDRLWNQYLSDSIGAADNVPGVLARALELAVRGGCPLHDKLEALRSHRLQPSVLYLASQQGITYLSRQDQKRFYLQALSSLKETRQLTTFRRLRQSIPEDLGITENDLQ